MRKKALADLCVISYSDLRYDARSSNLVGFYRDQGFKIVTYSISFDKSIEKNKFVVKVNKKNKFFLNWLKFLFKGVWNRPKLRAKQYFAADLYSLILLRMLLIPPKKIIYDSREIFSALGTLQNQSVKQKILSIVEKIAVKNLSKIVVSGELDAEYLKSYFNDNNKQYYVVKNLPNETKIIKTSYLRKKYNIPEDKTILIYQGVVLRGRGIMPLINALRKTEKYAFVIVGEGNLVDEIKPIVDNPDLKGKVFLHPQVNYSELLNITASADIGIGLIEPITFSYTLALPNKLFEYVYAGIPVLVSDLPAMTKFVLENGFGEVVSTAFDHQEILEKLMKISLNLSQYKKNIENKRNQLTYNSQKSVLTYLL